MSTEILNYKGTDITFLNSDNVMVNATDMLKAFPGKQMVNFTTLKGTKEYIEFLIKNATTSKSTDFINTKTANNQTVTEKSFMYKIKGGNNKMAQGTWMHEDLALYFAQWLSPEFHFWCNNRIKELLKVGVTAVDLNMLKDEHKKQIEELRANTDKANAELAAANAKNARFMEARNAISVGDFAKVYEAVGPNKVFSSMRDMKILKSRTGASYNTPYQRYIDSGYFKVKEKVNTGTYCNNNIYLVTLITPKGQVWLAEQLDIYLNKVVGGLGIL